MCFRTARGANSVTFKNESALAVLRGEYSTGGTTRDTGMDPFFQTKVVQRGELLVPQTPPLHCNMRHAFPLDLRL